MKISYNLLKSLIDFDLTPDELAFKLTMSGSEVENISVFGPFDPMIKIGLIQEVKNLPDYENLKLCQVDTGGNKLQLLSTAPNIFEGQKVIVAPAGAVINGITVEVKEFGGYRSQGMLVSKQELGYEEKSATIWEVGPNEVPGSQVNDLLGTDYVLELEITPNRPDCLCHLGIAREVGALLGKKLEIPQVQLVETNESACELYRVEIQDPADCPRYACRIIKGLKVHPSSLYLQSLLQSLGTRSINNVVDATNYSNLLLNQPMHAFDLEKLNSRKIIVRRASAGEKINTLDEVERELSGEVLLISTPERPVAIAGIMGGTETEVDSNTTSILLESAYFDPVRVRKGSKFLSLSSESSQRFERGIDPNKVAWAADFCADYLVSVAGGHVLKGIVDHYPRKIEPISIKLRQSKLHSLLGLYIPPNRTIQILESLGFGGVQALGASMDIIRCEAPTFRPDVTRETDLIEEVGRIYGYHEIEPCFRPGGKLSAELPEIFKFSNRAAEYLTNNGYYEITTVAMGTHEDLQPFNPYESLISLANPTSADFECLRPSLKPLMLQTVLYNLKQKIEDIRLFEIGNVYHDPGGKGYNEPLMLCIGICGRRKPLGWTADQEETDLFDLKGDLENLWPKLNTQKVIFKPKQFPFFNPDFSLEILAEDETVGEIGLLSDSIKKHFDIDKKLFLAEINLDKLLKHSLKSISFKEINRMPVTRRDLVIIVDENLPCSKILEAIQGFRGDIFESVELFDFYMGKNVPSGKKSLGFTLTYSNPRRTLTTEEVNDFHNKLSDSVLESFGGILPTKKETM
ncbi:phenylalanine--tRNA ligase subunit beta [bacterium]|nr:phenylalanine--tRNA ligase subunit beta [bacterium]